MVVIVVIVIVIVVVMVVIVIVIVVIVANNTITVNNKTNNNGRVNESVPRNRGAGKLWEGAPQASANHNNVAGIVIIVNVIRSLLCSLLFYGAGYAQQENNRSDTKPLITGKTKNKKRPITQTRTRPRKKQQQPKQQQQQPTATTTSKTTITTMKINYTTKQQTVGITNICRVSTFTPSSLAVVQS